MIISVKDGDKNGKAHGNLDAVMVVENIFQMGIAN